MVAILRDMGVKVEERHVTYGELVQRVRAKELVVAASIGTAGHHEPLPEAPLRRREERRHGHALADTGHPLYAKLAEAKAYYWNIYKEKVKLPAGMNLFKYAL